jgi:hypothetical protein
MFRRIPHPSPAMVVGLLALFVALSGTAVAAGIVPRARLADNATKLQGKTPTQVAALAPAPSSLAGYLTVKSSSWTLAASASGDFSAACDAGQKTVGGGYDNPQGDVLSLDTRPTSDGSSWRVYVLNLSTTAGASGSIYAVCLR